MDILGENTMIRAISRTARWGGAIAAAAVTALTPIGLALPSASAATPASPTGCQSYSHDGSYTHVLVTVCDGNADYMNGYLLNDNTGYFVFYGPHGQIHVSGRGSWGAYQVAETSFGPQTAGAGSLWCVDFWQGKATGPVTKLDTNCTGP